MQDYGTVGVVLDTEITESLRKEGYVREIISKVQNMRKEREFEVLDRIYLYISGNKRLEEIVLENKEFIKKETLTLDLIVREDMEHATECNINGEKILIDVEVAK